MRKYLLKITGILLFSAFSIFALNGCFFKKKIKTIDEELTSSLPSETLTVCFIGSEPSSAKSVLAEVQSRLKSTLNVKLDFKWIQSRNYPQEISTLMSSGQSIDAFQVAGSQQYDLLNTFIKQGSIMDITSLLKDKAPKLYALYGDKGFVNVTYDGKVMGLPNNFPRSGRICAVMNESTAQKYNVQTLKTFDDLEKLLQSLKESNDGKSPVAFNKNTFDLFGEAFGYINISPYLVYKQDDPNMKLVPWEQTNDFRKAVQTIQNWSDNKYFTATALRYLSSMNQLDTINRDMVDVVLTDWDYAQSYIHTHTGTAIKLKIFPLYPDKLTSIPGDYSAMAIYKNSKHAERVLKLFQWIQQSQENYDLFMYGIKDENYKLDNNRVSFTDDKSRYFGWDGSTTFININFTHLSVSDPQNFLEEYKKVTEGGTKYAPSSGFKPDYSAVQTQVNNRLQSFNSMTQMLYGFGISGTYIDEFINNNKTAGIDQVVTEVQKQLDQWKAKNK